MGEVAQISEFGKIFIFLITGFVLVALTLFIARLIAPNHPNAEKLTSYECGEEPTGSAWIPFNSRFYVIALIFLLFDVEMVFVIPWATVFGSKQLAAADSRWGAFTLIEMFVFLGILILGLVYVWRKGDLEWIKPEVTIPQVDTQVPQAMYDQLNQQQSEFKVRAFSFEPISPQAKPLEAASVAEPAPIRKPMFKSAFKKPGNES